MILLLQRLPPTDACQPGALLLDGEWFCRTLERRPGDLQYRQVPAGTYGVTLEPTHNPRLWSPAPDRWLPHVWGAPGRTGIEVHAGNSAADTEGCVLVGLEYHADRLSESRAALNALVGRLRAAKGPHALAIADPGA